MVPIGWVAADLDNAGRYLNLFGAVGGAIRGAQIAGKMIDRREAAEQLASGTDSATAMASGIEGLELMPLWSIEDVRVEKGFLKLRRLVIKTADGAERTYTYTDTAHPVPTLTAALGPILRERFHTPT